MWNEKVTLHFLPIQGQSKQKVWADSDTLSLVDHTLYPIHHRPTKNGECHWLKGLSQGCADIMQAMPARQELFIAQGKQRIYPPWKLTKVRLLQVSVNGAFEKLVTSLLVTSDLHGAPRGVLLPSPLDYGKFCSEYIPVIYSKCTG